MSNRLKSMTIAALLGAALGLGAASAQAEDIKFSIPLPLTGPLSFTGLVQQAGWQHAIAWVNANGGIRGRKIDVNFYDDEYKVDLGVAGFKKAAAAGGLVFASGDGTPFVRAISPENNETYKVLMSATGFASDVVQTDKYRYNFLVGPTYSDMIDILYKYMKDKQGKGAAPKVALIYSTTEFGRDPIAHAREKAKQLGIDIVLEDETKFTGVDVTPSAIKLRNAKPDYVIFHGYAGNVWPEIVKLAREYGVKSQFMGTVYGSDPELVRGVGPAADGFLGVIPFNLLAKDSNGKMMTVINDHLKTWTGKPYSGYANMGYVQSWLTTLLLRDVIGSVIDAGKPLTGDNLIAAVKALKNWDSGGIIGAPVTFASQRIPYGVIYRYHVKPDSFSMTMETGFTRVE